MNLLPILLIAAFPLAARIYAQNTPLTEPLTDESLATITCEVTQPPRAGEVPVLKSQKEADGTKGTYHYKLWVPKGYSADATKKWPCIFIMSPGGNAAMGPMENYLKNNGFIVVLLVEAKNGPWEPIVGDFLAAHDDVIKRLRVAEGQKYATGQSGGARASSIFVPLRPGFAGLIMQSAGPAFDASGNYDLAGLKRTPGVRLAMTMGTTDQNRAEADRMRSSFSKARLSVFEFNGGHVWAPADVFEKAMAWVTEKSAGSTASGAVHPGTSPSSFDAFFKK